MDRLTLTITAANAPHKPLIDAAACREEEEYRRWHAACFLTRLNVHREVIGADPSYLQDFREMATEEVLAITWPRRQKLCPLCQKPVLLNPV
jgi:hypothetical protein